MPAGVSPAGMLYVALAHQPMLGSRPMNSKKPIAMIAIAALLLGNVAGWVHVGGLHSCCSHPAAQISADTMDRAPQATLSAHAGDRSADHCHHRCCHHATDKSGPSDPSGDGASKSANSTPPTQHDSDSCSVCQNFFSTRQAVVLWTTVAAGLTIAVSHDVVLADDVFVSDTLLSRHWVRGPPRA